MSERTPESPNMPAIEDIPASAGALTCPKGPPTVLSPENWNPFWSEGLRDEAILRAIRPADLFSESTELLPGGTPTTSPPRDVPDAFKAVLQGLMSENARLWTERESWGQHHMNQRWGPFPNTMSQPNAWGSMWGTMSMPPSTTCSPMEGGLLGALVGGGSRGGQAGSYAYSGEFGTSGQRSTPKTSLMEVFNRVSAAGGLVQSMIPGVAEVSKTFSRACSGGQAEGTAGVVPQAPSHYESGSVKGGTRPGGGDSGQDQQKSTCAPGEAISEAEPSVRETGQPSALGPTVSEASSVRGGLHRGHPGWGAQGQGHMGGHGGLHGGGLPGAGGFLAGMGFPGHPGGGFPRGGNGLPGHHGGGGLPGGGFPGNPGGGGFPGPGGGNPGGGGFPGNPCGGGNPGGGGGFPGPGGGDPAMPYAGLPAWLGGIMAQQESVRAVDLPPLQELSESEIGPLIAGDWSTTVGPFLRDMSSSSSMWWDEVLNVAGNLYREWLNSEPMERLRLMPVAPLAFQRPPWLRIEQRGSVALLKAIPESIRAELVSQREVGSVSIIFKILRVYQPGGLGERTTLLKQLVDQKVPQPLGEWLTSLRAWRRWLTRVQELRIQPPDPVLLLSTLDRFAAGLAKHSSQVAFRLQVTRAALRVDVAPTEHGIQQFAESLLAEGEATFHGGSMAPLKDSVKIRALDGDGGGKDDGPKPQDGKDKAKDISDQKDQKDAKNVKTDAKPSKGDSKGGSSEKPVRRYFLSESGCKKGQKCSFPHEWKGVSKQGRCWTCGSTQHMKPDCPVKDVPKVKKEIVEDAKGKDGGGKGNESVGMSSGEASTPSSFTPPTVQPSEDLMKEVVQLLKSLRPAIKAVNMRSVNPKDGSARALLDGGATRILRPARSKAEFDKAIPIKVELAAGVTTLRQVESTGTLLTDFETPSCLLERWFGWGTR